jgi:hypothetical protein
MKETITFTQKILTPIKLFLFFACLLFYLLYSWNQSGGWIYLLLSILPLIAVIGYGKPLIFLQHVVIGDDKTITIRYWFGEGYTEKISKALYEILVTKDDKIRSYRFRIQNRHFQVSPCIYQHGEDLSEILEPFTKMKKINVRPAFLE